MKKSAVSILAVTTALLAAPAYAYVGPGAGISLLGALWGLIVGVVAAVGIILFWPVRIMLRKRKAEREAAEAGEQQEAAPETLQTEDEQQPS